MKQRQIVLFAGFLYMTFVSLLMLGCMPDALPQKSPNNQDPAGLWHGALHGFVAPIRFLLELPIYENVQTKWYDAGFTFSFVIAISIVLHFIVLPVSLLRGQKQLKGMIGALLMLIVGCAGLCAGLPYYLVDANDPYFMPTTWTAPDKGGGFLLGAWHACIAGIVCLGDLLGFEGNIVQTPNRQYVWGFLLADVLMLSPNALKTAMQQDDDTET